MDTGKHTTAKKWVYISSSAVQELAKTLGHVPELDEMKDILGHRAAALATMAHAGFPVPPSFTITTDACSEYLKTGGFAPGMWDQTLEALEEIGKQTGKKFGDVYSPFLVFIHSSPRVSMLGMMDAILNLGLNEEILQGLVHFTDNERFAYDTYRRFITVFSDIVMDYPREHFEEKLEKLKRREGVRTSPEVSPEGLKGLVEECKAMYRANLGEDFPTDPYKQLELAMKAVFDSWNGTRAVAYREHEGIPHDWGTAISVQAMVFGNIGGQSGTGIAFTRNPVTGEKRFYGDFLENAQGEDIVAGIRTPMSIERLQKVMPDVYHHLTTVGQQLEAYYRDMQDFEFAVEQGRLYVLAARTGKRTAAASLRIAIDLIDENVITEEEAVFHVTPDALVQVFAPKLPPGLDEQPIARGLNASAGVGVGTMVLDAREAALLGGAGEKVILVLPAASPEDFAGLLASQGVITTRGAATSHAAVVCRASHVPAVVGCEEIIVDTERRQFTTWKAGQVIQEGDLITIDGTSGLVFSGALPLMTVSLEDNPYLKRYASLVWALDPDDYVEYGLGTLWLLRDTIRDRSAPTAFTAISTPPMPQQAVTSPAIDDTGYVAFDQPSDVTFRNILDEIRWRVDPDTEAVAWGIMDTLLRLLQNQVGIGNHHLAVRPLVDPERSFVDLPNQSMTMDIDDSEAELAQLIGIEFFGINRWLRNCLPWGCLQWWGVVRLHSLELGRRWRLDKMNPRGESLVPGERNLEGFLVVLDSELLDIMKTKVFYSELRKREFGWNWYKKNNTSWQEVVEALRHVERGQTVHQALLAKCHSLCLLTQNFQLSSVGSWLLHEETATERRHFSFAGGRGMR